jgi:hypothetical protein
VPGIERAGELAVLGDDDRPELALLRQARERLCQGKAPTVGIAGLPIALLERRIRGRQRAWRRDITAKERGEEHGGSHPWEHSGTLVRPMLVSTLNRRAWLPALRPALLPAAVFALGACSKVATGELVPPAGVPAWESRFSQSYDDAYTREPVSLSGRAPNDVLDQRLLASRLGHAAVVALVRVDQVWGRGRYQGRQDQYLDVTIREVLLGELPRKAAPQQLLIVRSRDDLPGSLRGTDMILFLRWAPDEVPAYHHHLVQADEQMVGWVRAMVSHAKVEGVLSDEGTQRRRVRRRVRRRGKAG